MSILENFHRNIIRDWLNTIIYESNIFYFDYWSVIHLTSGLIIGYLLLIKYNIKSPVIKGFLILVAYEVIEYMSGDLIFEPEPKLDIIWDLIIGMLGIFLISIIKKYRSS